MEGLESSMAAFRRLIQEDTALASGACVGTEVDVLQRRYELCLEGVELTARLGARLAVRGALSGPDPGSAPGVTEADFLGVVRQNAATAAILERLAVLGTQQTHLVAGALGPERMFRSCVTVKNAFCGGAG